MLLSRGSRPWLCAVGPSGLLIGPGRFGRLKARVSACYPGAILPAPPASSPRIPPCRDATTSTRFCCIGSGPIVIGQACEFDYSGTQACKALREEGYEVVLVNSNPATIMTDPEMADRTYIEPLTWEIVEKVIEASGPTRCCRRSAARPALNLAMDLDHARRAREVRRRDDRRQRRGDRQGRGPRAVQGRRWSKIGLEVCRGETVHTLDEARECGRGDRPAVRWCGPASRWAAAARRSPTTARSSTSWCRCGLDQSPIHRGADRGVDPRLERVRDGGDARRGRQRRDHLLDRELRPDGRPHRRLDHRRPGPDAHRQGIPADARRLAGGDPRDRRRDGRLEHPVRHPPGRRAG